MDPLATATLDAPPSLSEGAAPLPGQGLVPPGVTPEAEGAHWDRVLSAAEAQARRNAELYDKFVRLFKDGQFSNLPSQALDMEHPSSRGCSANETYSHITTMMSVLLAQDPAFEVDPAGNAQNEVFALVGQLVGQDPKNLAKAFAETCEELLDNGYKDGAIEAQDLACLFACLVKGLGFSKTTWDPQRQRAREDTLNREEVYVDPEARFDLRGAAYVIHTCTMKIAAAKAFFRAKGLDETQVQAIQGNWSSLEDMTPAGALKRQENPQGEGQGGSRDLFRFHEIWTKDAGLDGSGRKEVLWKAWHVRGANFVHRQPWPFTLKGEEFPFSDLTFNRQYIQHSDAFPTLHVVEELRLAYEELVDFIRRHNLRSLARKILIDDELKSESDDILDFMLNASDLEARLVRKPANGTLKDGVHVVDMNTGTQPDVDVTEYLLKTRHRIEGSDELQRGAATHQMTAQEAAVRDEWAKTRVGRWLRIIDRWQADKARKRIQIERQLMPAEKVQKIATHPLAGLLWQVYAGDPDDLECEYSIGIASGSTGERHKQIKITRLQQAFEMGGNLNTLYQAPVVDLLKLWIEIQEANGVRTPERYLGPAGQQMLGLAPAPMMAPGMPAAPAMPMQPGQPMPMAGPGGPAPNVIPIQAA